MFGQHANPESRIDAISSGSIREDITAHRFPGQPVLGIGTEVSLFGITYLLPGLGTYVQTTAPAYVVAVEDIPDGVYEIWQVCEEHGTHKVYAQFEGDTVEGAEGPLPVLLFLAPAE